MYLVAMGCNTPGQLVNMAADSSNYGGWIALRQEAKVPPPAGWRKNVEWPKGAAIAVPSGPANVSPVRFKPFA